MGLLISFSTLYGISTSHYHYQRSGYHCIALFWLSEDKAPSTIEYLVRTMPVVFMRLELRTGQRWAWSQTLKVMKIEAEKVEGNQTCVWEEPEQRISWILQELEKQWISAQSLRERSLERTGRVTPAYGLVEKLRLNFKRLKKKWYLSELWDNMGFSVFSLTVS